MLEITRLSPIQRFETPPIAAPQSVVNAQVVHDPAFLHTELQGRLPINQTQGMNSLLLDAIADQTVSLRNDVLVTIRRQIDIPNLIQNARLLKADLRNVKNELREDMEEFRRLAKRYSKGSAAYELALIEQINSLNGEDTDAYVGLTEEFIHHYLQRYEAQLRAFLNISDVIAAHTEHIASEELSGAYEEILVNSQSLLQALSTIAKRIGMDQLAAWTPFLTQSAAVDLCSAHVGADKVHLMFVLQELKSLRVLNTFTTMLSEVEQRHLSNRTVNRYLEHSFEYAEQPLVTFNIIERWVAAASCQEQILFLQDYRNVFSKMTPEAYKDDEQRRNALVVLQNKIDDLVYNEET